MYIVLVTDFFLRGGGGVRECRLPLSCSACLLNYFCNWFTYSELVNERGNLEYVLPEVHPVIALACKSSPIITCTVSHACCRELFEKLQQT
jgi:hypothetical protein